MTPDAAIREATGGGLRPLYLVVGEETLLAGEVVAAIEAGADAGPARGFNHDKFMAVDARVEVALSAARTAPMMARRRFVLLRGIERWDGKTAQGDSSLDQLAEYAAQPVDSTVMVLVASKLNASRKLMRLAKKNDFVVSCQTLTRRELPGWIRQRAKSSGHAMSPAAVDALSELVGPELGPVADAIERLSLYVGNGAPIREGDVATLVTRVRQDTVWALVDALSTRNLAGALTALESAYDARDGGLPMLGAVSWRVRQLVKLQAALGRGRSASDAASESGVPPFKADELARVVRRLPAATLESWLLLLAEADLALKGSRRPGAEVLATMLVEMCRA